MNERTNEQWAKKYCLESDEEGEVGGLRKVKLERSGPSVSVSSGRQVGPIPFLGAIPCSDPKLTS